MHGPLASIEVPILFHVACMKHIFPFTTDKIVNIKNHVYGVTLSLYPHRARLKNMSDHGGKSNLRPLECQPNALLTELALG